MAISQTALLEEYEELSTKVSDQKLNLGAQDYGRLKSTIDYLVDGGYLCALKTGNGHVYLTTESFPYFENRLAEEYGAEVPKIIELERKIPHLKQLLVEGYIGKSLFSNPEFILWKTEVLIELRKMKQDPLIVEIEDILASFNGLSDEIKLNEIAVKLKILTKDIEVYLNPRQSTQGCIMNDKVFIVHGHDHKLLGEVELILRRIGLTPMIVMNEVNAGRTIIEKIEELSNVGFAIILYTGCDEGRQKGTAVLHDRARQNVIFEHGYLCAKLGRGHVVALNERGVEVPSDLAGVLYISLSDTDWKIRLMREMKAAGLKFDSTRA